MPSTQSARVQAGADAVQEEFDERGLGDGSLIAQVVIDESGYPAEVERLERRNADLEAENLILRDARKRHMRERDELRAEVRNWRYGHRA